MKRLANDNQIKVFNYIQLLKYPTYFFSLNPIRNYCDIVGKGDYEEWSINNWDKLTYDYIDYIASETNISKQEVETIVLNNMDFFMDEMSNYLELYIKQL